MRIEDPATVRAKWISIIVIGLFTLGPLLCFPPQRRVGNWTDTNDAPISMRAAEKFDRFMFGYFPSFQWIGRIGTTEQSLGQGKVTILGVGPYKYTSWHWTIDWLWAWGLVTIIAMFLVVIRLYRDHKM